MTAACNAPLIHRLKRRSREDADPALPKLIEEVESYLPGEPPASAATQPVVSLRLQTPLGEVKLFTVIATLGAPARRQGREPGDRDLPADGPRERSAARRAQRAPICLSIDGQRLRRTRHEGVGKRSPRR
jgi:hypothetical protein